ncbi:DUF3429 domain-containing protein [Marinomonas sp. A79]|uniref:DUF3429 domain-containing protein n=1 Tax=Marinomonas vulgaris TaxID=2823372 RepID=A0ABS5HDN0_9GAMM|nr:DUF3429 domain-containing protein [Marinomonas vulgaris]MBR7889059.1 DUF3429 domain-containing protein [Marinomonas vulgaris]
MRTPNSYLTIILGVLGIIPFAAATYISWNNHTFLGFSGFTLFSTYSAVILSFLSGALWGQLIHKDISPLGRFLFISSNVLALAAWASLLIHIPSLSIALLLLGFMSVFWVEARTLVLIRSPNARYLNMRFVITIIVCVLHLAMLYPHY